MVTSTETKTTKKLWIALGVMLVIILVFSMLAGLVHSSFGSVKIYDISYLTQEGGYQRALLYVPKAATSDNPAPAIVACHGYNNTAEVQDINSIELSRRGYVVIALDCYRHGLSSETDPNMPAAQGGGVYSALQYLGTLPYVDAGKIGMVGHSMGGGNIQSAALQAFKEHETDPSIIVPLAVVPTAAGFSYDTEKEIWPLAEYPVNGAVVAANFEEFAGVGNKGIDYNSRAQTVAAIGFVPEYDTFYVVDNDTPIDRAAAVSAAKAGQLRAIYMTYGATHPGVHFSNKAITNIVDFFDVTLRSGNATIAPGNAIWMLKHYFSLIAMVAFIFLVIPVGGLLLETPFFSSIVRPAPESYATAEKGKGRGRYILLFVLGLIPAGVLYYFCTAWGSKLLSNFFPLPAVNGIVVLNVLTGLISLLLFFIYYKTMYKKNGASLDNMGVKLPFKEVLKGILLALITFACCYLMLIAVDYLFKVDFRFWVFSFRTVTPAKWPVWLRYVIPYGLFFMISSLTLNMSTRIKGKSNLVNYIVGVIGSMGGLLALCLLDYGVFFATGLKLLPMVAGANTSLAGILLWGVIFILPFSSIISQWFFRKTGSFWVGGFVNTFLVTFFAISNTIINNIPLH